MEPLAACSHQTPALGARHVDGESLAHNRKGNVAACLGVVRRLALNIALMYPDKRSVRREFAHAQRNDDVLLSMNRSIRRREYAGIHTRLPASQANRLVSRSPQPYNAQS